jgi:hypothetical protein
MTSKELDPTSVDGSIGLIKGEKNTIKHKGKLYPKV